MPDSNHSSNIDVVVSDSDIVARSRDVVADALERRGRGEFLPDDRIVAAHPDLMPQLGSELTVAGQIHRAVLTARRAGRFASRLRYETERSGNDPAIDQARWGSVELLPADKGSGDLIATLDASPGLGLLDRTLWDPRNAPDSPSSTASMRDDAPSAQDFLGDVEELPQIQGYILLHEVATGGQATVFKAIHEATGRRVAVRVLHGIHSRARIRADREADILAALDHPNLIKVTDRGRTAAGLYFICMDYVEGYALDEFLAPTCPRGPVNLPALLSLFTRLCRAMGQAHEQGVVHRDLKPSNVRVDISGEPRVLDFGLARPAAGALRGAWATHPTVTADGQIVGTPPWISPEQAAGDSAGVGPQADVYALGVMLYYALTGDFPHPTDGTLGEVLAHIANTPPRPMTGKLLPRWGSYIPDQLSTVCERCLAKLPSDRFASATPLADALDGVFSAILRGTDLETSSAALPAALASTRTSQRKRRVAFRHWLVWGGAAVAATVAIAILPWKSPGPVPPIAMAVGIPRVPEPYVNHLGMKLVYVAPGDFIMGSRADEPRRQLDPVELRHTVRIERGFYMATLEVTQAQYRAVLKSMPSQRWPGDNLPVHGITWEEANRFCNELSIQTGLKYRLPTDAEWEYACRECGQFTGAYAGGEHMAEVGWYVENAGQLGVQRGGQLRPNALGLFDMHGNVREYCSDWHALYEPGDIPKADHGGPATGVTKVTRGGDIFDQAEYCRAARRGASRPNSVQGAPGIRVVLEAPSKR